MAIIKFIAVTVLTIFAIINSARAVVPFFGRDPGARFISNQDDFQTSAIDLDHGDLCMYGERYGAYAVSTNGYILLLTNTDSAVTNYGYSPQRLSGLRGSAAMVAPFWADINLRCSTSAPEYNRVYYEETTNSHVLRTIGSIRPLGGFTPTSALIVTYEHVTEFPCPNSADGNENTFQLVIAADSSCNTHFLFLYENMEWSDTNRIGFTNGRGSSAEYRGHNGNVHLLTGHFVYSTRPIIQAITQINKGNMVSMQQSGKDGGGMVYIQDMELGLEKVVSRKQQEELRDEGRTMSQQEGLSDEGGAMSQQSGKDGSTEALEAIAVLKKFVGKKLVQSELNAALQESFMKKVKA